MRLSIVIPVYKVEDYIAECLESILMQSSDNNQYEIIVVNDESPDRSMEIVEQYQRQYKQIKIVNRKNGGVAAARNSGIEHATGEYIALLDSDDFYSKDFFKELFEVLDHHPDVVMYDFDYYYKQQSRSDRVKRYIKKQDIDGKSGAEVLEAILEKEPLFTWYPWAYVIKRELLLQHELYFVPNRNYEDIYWTPLVFLYANKMIYLDQSVLNYRMMRKGQITGTVNLKNLTDAFYAPVFLTERMQYIDVPAKLKHQIINSVSNKYFVAPFYSNALSKDDKRILIQRMKENHVIIGNTTSKLTKIVNTMLVYLGVAPTVHILGTVHGTYKKIKSKVRK